MDKPKFFRVLKNLSNLDIKTTFRGRPIVFLARTSMAFKNNDADERADFLLQTYSFLQDVTDRILEKGGK